MNKHTMNDLYQMQGLPLSVKIAKTKLRIKEWINEFGDDGVYVAFSGGKDSTVLLDLVRQDYPNVEAVYVDTGLEYPEIREFVNTFDNVTILKPKMNFRQVIEKYGYPFISKEVSECVDGARKYLENLLDRQTDRQTDRQPYLYEYNKLLGIGEYSKFSDSLSAVNPSRGGTTTSIENSEELASILNQRMKTKSGGNNRRLAIMLGWLTKDKEEPIKVNIPSKDKSMFSQEKYKFFLDAPFEISNKCCNVMKKDPSHRYSKETKKKPMTAQMASESRLRTQQWLNNGCNGFEMKNPISNPMSFWTEQDVLLYIKMNNLRICSVYGEIVEKDEIDGQMSIFDYESVADKELFESDMPTLTTTGCKRTGCMFCGYGAHCKGDTRFLDMKETHPKTYEWIMKPWDEGGLNYKEVIDWINEHGNLDIKY